MKASPTYRAVTFSDRLILLLEKAKNPIFYVVLFIWALVCIAPLYFTLVFSLKPVANIYDEPLFFPNPFSLENYRDVIGALPLFPRWLLNSMLISFAVTCLRVLFCAMGGYAFPAWSFRSKIFSSMPCWCR